jgi:hypothetical protein
MPESGALKVLRLQVFQTRAIGGSSKLEIMTCSTAKVIIFKYVRPRFAGAFSLGRIVLSLSRRKCGFLAIANQIPKSLLQAHLPPLLGVKPY